MLKISAIKYNYKNDFSNVEAKIAWKYQMMMIMNLILFYNQNASPCEQLWNVSIRSKTQVVISYILNLRADSLNRKTPNMEH